MLLLSASLIHLTKMPRSDPMTGGAIVHRLFGMLLVAVVVGAAAFSVDADFFSCPAFDASVLASPATAEFNRSAGFLLLSQTIDVWRAGRGGAPVLEASINTSFALSGAAPVAFVVLNDTDATLNVTGGLRGLANYSASDAEHGATTRSASGSLASVEAGPVRPYGPGIPAVGLHVTVTPNGTATTSRAVWIEYDAAVHRLSVYVAGAGEARPAAALLDARLVLAGRRTSEKAKVGFFAGTMKDILDGIHGWNLTVDRLDSSGGDGCKKGTSWWLVLLAVLGTVAAMA